MIGDLGLANADSELLLWEAGEGQGVMSVAEIGQAGHAMACSPSTPSAAPLS